MGWILKSVLLQYQVDRAWQAYTWWKILQDNDQSFPAES